jgi:D-alanine-D-alanine ligase
MEMDELRTDIPVAVLYDIDPSWTSGEVHDTTNQVRELESRLRTVGHRVAMVPVFHGELGTVLSRFDPSRWIVLNWVDGLPGHDRGDVVAALELRLNGYTYTGSPPEVLALSYDKPRCKQLLRRAGVPTPRGRVYDHSGAVDWSEFPAIVKPAHAHCSTGITSDSVVLGRPDLRRRVEHVIETHGQPALVEPFVDGREFHVSLWGNGRIDVLPPAEMDFSRFDDVRDRLCTWDAKFNPGSRHYEGISVKLPADLDESELGTLERVSLAAARVVGCRDYARVDLRLQDGDFLVLDVNPNPDITHDASFALAAELVGTSYGELGSRLVNLAAQRHPLLGATA